jgi:hypothetical protein
MANILPLVLDVVVVGLLVATISYAIILNRQLIRLRESRGEMEELVRNFSEATGRAEAGIKAMRRAAAEVGEGLQRNIERAQALRDELQFMIEAADGVAARLEGVVSSNRGTAAPPAVAGGNRMPAKAASVPARRPMPEPRRPVMDVDEDEPALRSLAASVARGDLGMVERNDAGRGEGGRGEGGRSDGGRGDGVRRQPSRTLTEIEPRPMREGTEGLSRAERELLEAMENRR